MSTPQGGQPGNDQDGRQWSGQQPEPEPADDAGATTVFRPGDMAPDASPIDHPVASPRTARPTRHRSAGAPCPGPGPAASPADRVRRGYQDYSRLARLGSASSPTRHRPRLSRPTASRAGTASSPTASSRRPTTRRLRAAARPRVTGSSTRRRDTSSRGDQQGYGQPAGSVPTSPADQQGYGSQHVLRSAACLRHNRAASSRVTANPRPASRPTASPTTASRVPAGLRPALRSAAGLRSAGVRTAGQRLRCSRPPPGTAPTTSPAARRPVVSPPPTRPAEEVEPGLDHRHRGRRGAARACRRRAVRLARIPEQEGVRRASGHARVSPRC